MNTAIKQLRKYYADHWRALSHADRLFSMAVQQKDRRKKARLKKSVRKWERKSDTIARKYKKLLARARSKKLRYLEGAPESWYK
jgi:hypothetical protein